MTPPTFLYPGVYIEGMSGLPRLIQGAEMSVAAFVGQARSGPKNKPVFIRSVKEFSEVFGVGGTDDVAALAVRLFFENGGSQACFVRVAARRGRGAAGAIATTLVGNPAKRTGIHALPEDAGIGLLSIPELALLEPAEALKATNAVLSFCDQRGIFCILDAPRANDGVPSVDEALRWAGSIGVAARRNAAVYFPFVETGELAPKSKSVAMPASGAVAGVYARIDARRGVWKEPAGPEALLRGVGGPANKLTETEMGRLLEGGINPIRQSPEGLVVWGAHTLDAVNPTSEWRYVSVRRLVMFLEKSICRGLRWVVFEPKGEPLCRQIRLGVGSFLNQAFRSGAFAGARPRDAYFVRCEPGEGSVVVEFGVAPLRPAEFVIVRMRIDIERSGA